MSDYAQDDKKESGAATDGGLAERVRLRSWAFQAADGWVASEDPVTLAQWVRAAFPAAVVIPEEEKP